MDLALPISVGSGHAGFLFRNLHPGLPRTDHRRQRRSRQRKHYGQWDLGRGCPGQLDPDHFACQRQRQLHRDLHGETEHRPGPHDDHPHRWPALQREPGRRNQHLRRHVQSQFARTADCRPRRPRHRAGHPLRVSRAAPTSPCAGTCSLSPPGQPIAAPGGPATVTVTATSTWTVAAPTDSWVHLTSPASNNGNATVTFTVDANTGPPRSSTTSVANQNFTIYQNGTPASTTTGCAYLIQSSTTQSIPNTGTTSGLIQVITAQNCAWTASTAATWITLKSGTSSTGRSEERRVG